MNRAEELIIGLDMETLNAEIAYMIVHDHSGTEDGLYRGSTGEASRIAQSGQWDARP